MTEQQIQEAISSKRRCILTPEGKAWWTKKQADIYAQNLRFKSPYAKPIEQTTENESFICEEIEYRYVSIEKLAPCALNVSDNKLTVWCYQPPHKQHFPIPLQYLQPTQICGI